jgi:hypothetical protein
MPSFYWFREELKSIAPNGELRLVRDPHRLGLDLWVIERRLPPSEHADMLESLRLCGEARFVDVIAAGIGPVKYDVAPGWAIGHVCRAKSCRHQPPQFSDHDPECYREPNHEDLAAIRRWLYEFRDFQHSMEVLRQEAKERKEKEKQWFSDFMAKELKSSHVFRDLKFYDAPKTEFKEKTEEGKSNLIWLPQ